MTPASAPHPSPAPMPLGENKTPRLPACPTTRGKSRPRVAPLASESDPHPVVQVVWARAYTLHSTHRSLEVRTRRQTNCYLHPETDR